MTNTVSKMASASSTDRIKKGSDCAFYHNTLDLTFGPESFSPLFGLDAYLMLQKLMYGVFVYN